MNEEPTPLGPEEIEEATVRLLGPELLARYLEMKRMYREICRGIRHRHKGQAREAMLRYEEEVFRQKVKQLIEGLPRP